MISRIREFLSPDPSVCVRCGHFEDLHRSTVLYPAMNPDWPRPGILAAPRGVPSNAALMAFGVRTVSGCGCPNFVRPAPAWLRSLTWLAARRWVVGVWSLYLVALIFAGVVHAPLKIYAPMFAIGVLLVAFWGYVAVMFVQDTRKASR